MKHVRQQEILALIRQESYVSTEALANHFKVSAQTIRRDLEELEQQGIVNKMYGGASLVGGEVGDSNFSFYSYIPSTEYEKEKEAICMKGMDYVNDGDTIALDVGSTTRLLVSYLNKKNNLVIITKDMLVASALYNHPTNRVYLIGGFLGASGTTSGEFIREFLESVSKIDLFFLSTNGITVAEGFTNDYAGVETYRAYFLPLAMQRVALADHTKFGNIGFYRTCDLTDVDHIITDSGVDRKIVEDMRMAGADVIIADTNTKAGA